jgi:oxaloacetate decarboxylase gamma subunit
MGTEEINLVSEGVKFMILGMGTVFVFLILMIVVLNVQAKVIHRFFPQTSQPQAQSNTSPKKKSDDKKIVAAITGAVTAYRK